MPWAQDGLPRPTPPPLRDPKQAIRRHKPKPALPILTGHSTRTQGTYLMYEAYDIAEALGVAIMPYTANATAIAASSGTGLNMFPPSFLPRPRQSEHTCSV